MVSLIQRVLFLRFHCNALTYCVVSMILYSYMVFLVCTVQPLFRHIVNQMLSLLSSTLYIR